jgi:hypothetical protein
MGPRVQFVCQSSSCRRQVVVEARAGGATGQVSNPGCTCGSEMKRVYSKPAFRILSKEEVEQRLGDFDVPKSSAKSAD